MLCTNDSFSTSVVHGPDVKILSAQTVTGYEQSYDLFLLQCCVLLPLSCTK